MVSLAASNWVGAIELLIGYFQLESAISQCINAGCPVRLVNSARATGVGTLEIVALGFVIGFAFLLVGFWVDRWRARHPLPEETRERPPSDAEWSPRRDELEGLTGDAPLDFTIEQARWEAKMLQRDSSQVAGRSSTLLGLASAFIGGTVAALAYRTVSIDSFFAIQALSFLVIAEAAFYMAHVSVADSRRVSPVTMLNGVGSPTASLKRQTLFAMFRVYETNYEGLASRQDLLIGGTVVLLVGTLVLVFAFLLG